MLTPYDFAIFLKSYALVAARRFVGETVFVILLNTSGIGIPACNCPAISVFSDFCGSIYHICNIGCLGGIQPVHNRGKARPQGGIRKVDRCRKQQPKQHKSDPEISPGTHVTRASQHCTTTVGPDQEQIYFKNSKKFA
ncbi:hypothetical protein CEXT_570021 [Caerostris extrusa]|uniref:Uncharacterized protein n=1 Tax=Caerostris extrusa TaxID=172846 RepID=A0AAV4XNN7_CAEEX|nr:hypothetical protein CEXT_570021 [Caerostris extrusa]